MKGIKNFTVESIPVLGLDEPLRVVRAGNRVLFVARQIAAFVGYADGSATASRRLGKSDRLIVEGRDAGRISEKTDRRVFYTLIALLVLGLLALAGILLNKYVMPRYWDYQIAQADGAWQKFDLSFSCPRANLLIINGSRSVTRSPHREILSQPLYYQVPENATVTKTDGILQIGGYGTQFKGGPLDREQFKTFFTADPDYLRCEITLYRNTWSKKFQLDPRGRTVTVDGTVYDLGGDSNGAKPVVLYVDEDGGVRKIDDFEWEFGESPEAYVRMPVLLPLPKSLEAQHEENGDATKAFPPPD